MSATNISACGCQSGACAVSLTPEPAAPPPGGEDSHAREARRERFILGSSALIYGLTLFFSDNIEALLGIWGLWAFYAVPYALCGWSIVLTAARLMARGDVFNEFTLMTGATLAAIALGEIPEAVGVMLFYRMGEYVQEGATARSVRSIRSLLASKPTTAHVVTPEGTVTQAVESVEPGQTIEVRAGEKIPLDGEVLAGTSEVDQSPLTGESVPVIMREGAQVLGGSINLTGVLSVRVSSRFSDSHMARILDMVQNAAANKSPTERFITRFARYYTPAVVLGALLVATLPPLLLGQPWETWGYRALVLLVISCPCALLISIPLGYFGGIGAASKKGILVKGGTIFDDLAHIRTVVFDKTGTLTKGSFMVVAVVPAPGVEEAEIVRAALIAERASNHPIARSIRAYGDAAGGRIPRDTEGVTRREEEIAGKGMLVTVNDGRFLAGTADLIREHGYTPMDTAAASGAEAGAVVHVAHNDRYLGFILVNDTLKEDARSTIVDLKAAGIQTYMLTGDREQAAAWVAGELGLNGYWSGLLPEGKVQAMQALGSGAQAMFVGDGINDAPILATARVGVAMGGMGAEAAIEAADVVIVNDAPSRVVALFRLSRKVRAIVWQNIVLALSVKTGFMVLGVVGLSGLWEAVFADVGVALLAVLNSTRAMRS